MSAYHRLLERLGPHAIVFTRRQARAAGVSEHELRRRVAEGSLIKVGPNAFRGSLIDMDPRASLRCLLADVGEPVWVHGVTAAWLHGFDGFGPSRPFHLTVPVTRHVARPNVRIHTHKRPLEPVDRTHVSGLPVTSPVRTMIDLARTESPRRLTLALDSGLRDGKFTEASLLRRIDQIRSQGRHGITRLLDVIDGIDVVRGGHSFLERAFLELLDHHGLPKPEAQQVLARTRSRVVRTDFSFPGTPVVVEVLGIRYHRSEAQIRRDTERMNALMLAGKRVYQYTYTHVLHEEHLVATELRDAFSVRAA